MSAPFLLKRRPRCAMCDQPVDASRKRAEAVRRAESLERELRDMRATADMWRRRAENAELVLKTAAALDAEPSGRQE